MAQSNTSDYQTKARPGGWLPRDPAEVARWIRKLKQAAAAQPRDLIPPIAEFQQMIHSDPVLHGTMAAMFAEAYQREQTTPLDWQHEVKTLEEFLLLLNQIMFTAPECYYAVESGQRVPAGLIGFPINALLDWPMATSFGYDVFANALVNQQFKKILNFWSRFLVTPESRYVLVQDDPECQAVGWLSETAKAWIVETANQALGAETSLVIPERFEDIFQCNPADPYYGYGCWDDFFTRRFVAGVRPVAAPEDANVIVNACESAPFALARNVPLSAPFWLKGQPYSLENMLNGDAYTPQFDGGTVYQAFLSALSFHRWNSPVDGTIRKTAIVAGSYYLESLYQGFVDPDGADPSAPNNSQGFLASVATRALIFIEADNPKIGLMCVMPIGMAEVSSCEITVKEGQHVKKGDPLGMFHFGGSTHCLIFRPGVELDFELYGLTPGPSNSTNIRVNTVIARCK